MRTPTSTGAPKKSAQRLFRIIRAICTRRAQRKARRRESEAEHDGPGVGVACGRPFALAHRAKAKTAHVERTLTLTFDVRCERNGVRRRLLPPRSRVARTETPRSEHRSRDDRGHESANQPNACAHHGYSPTTRPKASTARPKDATVRTAKPCRHAEMSRTDRTTGSTAGSLRDEILPLPQIVYETGRDATFAELLGGERRPRRFEVRLFRLRWPTRVHNRSAPECNHVGAAGE